LERITNKGVYGGMTAFTQTTASNQPEVTSWTGGSGVSISAVTNSDNWLQGIVATTASTNWTRIIVISEPNQAQSFRFSRNSDSSSYTIFPGLNSTTVRNATFNNSTGQYWRQDCSLTNRPQTGQTIVSYVSTSASTIVSYMTINSSATTNSDAGGSVQSSAQNFPGASTLFLINESGVSPYVGQIAEILLITRELTTTETNNLLSYLKTKWGLKY